MITTSPLTIIADDREKAPYAFTDLGEVHVVRQRLSVGDYSLPFRTDMVCVSRKSLVDLYATLLDAERRQRFKTELRLMQLMAKAMVVIEDNYKTADPPPGFHHACRVTVCHVVSWLEESMESVRWQTCKGRRDAEIATWSFLTAAREEFQRESIADYEGVQLRNHTNR